MNINKHIVSNKHMDDQCALLREWMRAEIAYALKNHNTKPDDYATACNEEYQADILFKKMKISLR